MLFECCCFSVAKSCLTLCDGMDCSMPGSSVLHFSQSLLRFISFELVMLSNHIIFSSRLFHLPSIFPASGSFPMSQVFKSCGQNIEASATNLPMNIQGWFPLRLTGLISLLFKGLSRVFPSTIRKHQLFDISLLYGPTLTSIPDYWKNHSFDYMDFCQQWCLCFLICCLGWS